MSLLGASSEITVVGEAASGEDAVTLAQELHPDVILMDLSMPGIGGLTASRRILEHDPSVRILVLTVSDAEHDLFEAIQLGACGYLLKSADPDDLVSAIKEARRGEAPLSPPMAAKVLRELAHPTEASPPQQVLSPRELEVLAHVARGAANKEIAIALGISENTVKNHLRNILEKLHLENRVQAAVYALRQGVGSTPKS